MVWAVAAAAPAEERQVLGRRLVVKDPAPADAARRSLALRAIEHHSDDLVVGDPTLPLGAGGAVLEIAAQGGTDSWQTFGLAQGTRSDGNPFWVALDGGFAYADPRGEQGPVSRVLLHRSPRGSLRLAVNLAARFAPLDVVPPNPGSEAFVALSLSGGDRYCVGFGPDAAQRNRGAQFWLVRNAPAERCGTPPLTSGDFLALAYNVAGLPEGLSGSHPETNTPLISPLLNGYDLVVVQESWQTPDPNPLAPLRVYHELLVADATHAYQSVSAPLPLGADPFRPSALVSDGLNMLSRFPFSGMQRHPWTNCGPSAADCLALKGFMFARTTIAPGVTVDVYNLHMEAGGEPLDDVLRDENVTQLANAINTHSVGRAVLVGGDFNLHTNTEPDSTQFQRLLAETGLVDVCAAVGCPQPGRIDKWLFRSGGGITVTPLSWQFETAVFQDGAGQPLSDHDALAVRFAWQLE
jgi:endonuclease/exonuclease/phosphatase family metal-dependent hydrolase